MNILYATDGTRPAVDAVRLLVKVARRGACDITVLTVAVPQAANPAVLDTAPESGHETELSRAAGIAEDAARTLAAHGLPATSEVVEGLPAPEIIKMLDSGGYDLAVVGAGARSWLGRMLLGSVSTHVLHATRTSVLIVHEGPEAIEPARIVVGVDGSDGAKTALQRVIEFCDPGRCVVEPFSAAPPAEPVPVLLPVPAPELHEQEEAMRRLRLDRAEERSQRAAQTLEAAGFKAEPFAGSGPPVPLLLREADTAKADMVVVGSRGLGPVGRSILGSVSDQVARHARATLVAR